MQLCKSAPIYVFIFVLKFQFVIKISSLISARYSSQTNAAFRYDEGQIEGRGSGSWVVIICVIIFYICDSIYLHFVILQGYQDPK